MMVQAPYGAPMSMQQQPGVMIVQPMAPMANNYMNNGIDCQHPVCSLVIALVVATCHYVAVVTSYYASSFIERKLQIGVFFLPCALQSGVV